LLLIYFQILIIYYYYYSLKADGYTIEISNIGTYKYNEVKPLKYPIEKLSKQMPLLRNNRFNKSSESINKKIKRLSREDCDTVLSTWSSKSNLNIVKRDGKCMLFYNKTNTKIN
jgi:hypothetical protein